MSIFAKKKICKMAKSKWNHDTCLEEARKYKSRSEFKKKSNGAYLAALRHGWLNDCTWVEEESTRHHDRCLAEEHK